MTTFENRPNTALLVVDVQKGVVEEAHERDAVVANVGSLVEKARQEQVPVVWVQHSDEQLVRTAGSAAAISPSAADVAGATDARTFATSEAGRRHETGGSRGPDRACRATHEPAVARSGRRRATSRR